MGFIQPEAKGPETNKVNFEISAKFRFINIEEPYYQREPVKPEDLIKAIINNEQTKNSIENAIKELTATLQKLHS
jgi:hypothetical protein